MFFDLINKFNCLYVYLTIKVKMEILTKSMIHNPCNFYEYFQHCQRLNLSYSNSKHLNFYQTNAQVDNVCIILWLYKNFQ